MLTIFASFASNTFWLIINNLQMLKPAILCQDNVNKSIIKLLHFNVQSLFSSQQRKQKSHYLLSLFASLLTVTVIHLNLYVCRDKTLVLWAAIQLPVVPEGLSPWLNVLT